MARIGLSLYRLPAFVDDKIKELIVVVGTKVLKEERIPISQNSSPDVCQSVAMTGIRKKSLQWYRWKVRAWQHFSTEEHGIFIGHPVAPFLTEIDLFLDRMFMNSVR